MPLFNDALITVQQSSTPDGLINLISIFTIPVESTPVNDAKNDELDNPLITDRDPSEISGALVSVGVGVSQSYQDIQDRAVGLTVSVGF